jgi:hypothetical protein
VTWLGAAALRAVSLKDRPDTDVSYWGYLAAELIFGVSALGSR